MSAILMRWNELATAEAAREILPCCGSQRWAHALARLRPLTDAEALLAQSDEIWWQLDPADWSEAFSSHPRIGEKKAPESATAKSADWSRQEQGGVACSSESIQEQLKRANDDYEQRFGRIYIVCASGKSVEEMLAILYRRLENDEASELREAAEQQRQITQLRLRKWLEL
ncbi:MAG: 2-oxo-4-hydroxy-4-carboxy-5-ureidoimidazoline decarboxylase [Silvibacterium sp.]